MKSKYKVVFLITVLLIILSLSISFVNYFISFTTAERQLKEQSLPLSLDNIYTDIEHYIIRPHFLSSVMSNNTFLKQWLESEEKDIHKIKNYLQSIKKEYNLYNTFLVSEKTKNYYSENGVLETLSEENILNNWYYDFIKKQKKHEINLDINKFMSSSLIVFINYKIFDEDSKLLGVTGVALKTSYINELLKTFRTKHGFIVTFYNKDGDIVLSERSINSSNTIHNKIDFEKIKNQILNKESSIIEYTKDSHSYILNSKYIPELDLYLTVEANLKDFTTDVKNIFIFNILISIFITIVIALMIFFIIKNYSKKLEFMSDNDSLTKISNRRDFENRLKAQHDLLNRKKNEISILFLDIDDFKNLNDTLGHHTGDKVLVRVAKILKNDIRKSDILARWGGEEFIIALIDSNIDDSKMLSEKLRVLIQTDLELNKIAKRRVTVSFGLTKLNEKETIEEAISRADKAMYLSKNAGKNQVCIL